MGIFTKTKIVEVEKIVEKERVVIGEPHRVTLYHALDPGYFNHIYISSNRAAKSYGYFISCEEAFAASDDINLKVEKVDALIIKNEYFIIRGLDPVKVTKTKVAKGKK